MPLIMSIKNGYSDVDRIDLEICESEKEVANGAETVDVEIVFSELEKRYFR